MAHATINQVAPADVDARFSRWTERVRDLVAQLADWYRAEGWTVVESPMTIREPGLPEYELPRLIVHVTDREELHVKPIGLRLPYAVGRVDLEGYPTLSRVKLMARPDGWQIMTDSRVPLRVPWTRESFVQLATDLVA